MPPIGAVSLLLRQLERGLKKVHEQPHRRIELRKGSRSGFKPLQPTMPDNAPDHGAVLLFDERLIALVVRSGAGELDTGIQISRY